MNSSGSPFPIVCLGESAGALSAYRAILRAVPADSGKAFILVAHRRVGFDHLLGPLLEAVTTMPVSAVEQGQRIAPNTVVLVPAQRRDLMGYAPAHHTAGPIGSVPSLNTFVKAGRSLSRRSDAARTLRPWRRRPSAP